MNESEEPRLIDCAICGNIGISYDVDLWEVSGDPTEFAEFDEWLPLCKDCQKSMRPKPTNNVNATRPENGSSATANGSSALVANNVGGSADGHSAERKSEGSDKTSKESPKEGAKKTDG